MAMAWSLRGAAGRRLRRRRAAGVGFLALATVATCVGIVFLAVLLWDVFSTGLPHLSWDFVTGLPSRFSDRAGIKPALFGTLWLMGFTALFSFPLGVGAAVYLEEYARKGWITDVIRINIGNLAGVPSIVYGLLGLTLFVRWLALGRSVLAGSLTMTLLILPIVIVASQEAIRAIPDSQRHAAYALGATRWQVVRRVVLPQALPGVLTGTILALSRAIGETAPLIMIGALTAVFFIPTSPMDPFTALPIQIFNWTSRPQEGFRDIAAAGIVLLLIVLLSMNAFAILVRNRYQRRSEE